MTKNLRRVDIVRNLEILKLIEEQGRSVKAAQLHAVGVKFEDVVGLMSVAVVRSRRGGS